MKALRLFGTERQFVTVTHKADQFVTFTNFYKPTVLTIPTVTS